MHHLRVAGELGELGLAEHRREINNGGLATPIELDGSAGQRIERQAQAADGPQLPAALGQGDPGVVGLGEIDLAHIVHVQRAALRAHGQGDGGGGEFQQPAAQGATLPEAHGGRGGQGHGPGMAADGGSGWPGLNRRRPPDRQRSGSHGKPQRHQHQGQQQGTGWRQRWLDVGEAHGKAISGFELG